MAIPQRKERLRVFNVMKSCFTKLDVLVFDERIDKDVMSLRSQIDIWDVTADIFAYYDFNENSAGVTLTVGRVYGREAIEKAKEIIDVVNRHVFLNHWSIDDQKGEVTLYMYTVSTNTASFEREFRSGFYDLLDSAIQIYPFIAKQIQDIEFFRERTKRLDEIRRS